MRAGAGLAVLGLLSLAQPAGGQQQLRIVERPIGFGAERIALTLDYIRLHYGLTVQNVRIVPQAVVIHWTGTTSLKATWHGFNRVRARRSRWHLRRGGLLNVSAHFLVDRDGTIYRLMPEDWMACHCIGLNYDSIGIENLGGTSSHPLTLQQVQANAALIEQLVTRHPIRYVLGHLEWRRFAQAPFFRELDPTYRNAKADPGLRFMTSLRRRIRKLGLKDRFSPP